MGVIRLRSGFQRQHLEEESRRCVGRAPLPAKLVSLGLAGEAIGNSSHYDGAAFRNDMCSFKKAAPLHFDSQRVAIVLLQVSRNSSSIVSNYRLAGGNRAHLHIRLTVTKPAFREAFQRRQCLGKQPYAIALADRHLMVLAGLWETWRSPAGERIRSFTIVTTTPNELCAELHNRMPVVLKPQAWPVWLGEEPADLPQLKALLAPYPSDEMMLAGERACRQRQEQRSQPNRAARRSVIALAEAIRLHPYIGCRAHQRK
jgi:hypothetical protein